MNRPVRILSAALALAAGAALCGVGAGPTAAAAVTGPVTVAAPGAGPNATVTVSRTTDLVNQSVQVSWTGFTPSSDTVLHRFNGAYDVNTKNPVRVYECRGKDPASSSSCYGSTGYDGVPATPGNPGIPAVPGYTYSGQTSSNDVTPDGPGNSQDTVTRADGTGGAVIQIFTTRESASLACDSTSPCSLVVVPNYGPAAPPGDATEPSLDAPWSWARRTVVPLSFSPLGSACPLTAPDVTLEGSPIAARSALSWRAGACVSKSNKVVLDYTSIPEPQARQDFAAGNSTVALTQRPLEPGVAATAPPYSYAPVAVSGVVAAFQVDDANGQPVSAMHLNARLVAKVITASYYIGSDSNVTGNPRSLFQDPEFLALNPGVDWPEDVGNQPLLVAGDTDVTWALTRWINADADARSFLDGTPDPWGMHVNTAYKGVALPVTNFPLLDQAQSNNFVPVQGLDALGRQLSLGTLSSVTQTTDPATGQTVVTKAAPQNPGQHRILGFVSSADAAAFLLPTAGLLTKAGNYVSPTADSMTAALADMTVDSNGVTRSFDLASTDAAAYPLTVLTAAMVPLTASTTVEGNVARFLKYATGYGQSGGTALGQLPAGFAPLTAALKKQDTTVINRVEAAAAAKPAAPAASAKPAVATKAAAAPAETSGDAAPPVSLPTTVVTPAAAPTVSAPAPALAVATPAATASVAPAALSLAAQQAGLAADSGKGLPLLEIVLAAGGAAALLGAALWRAGRGSGGAA